MYLTKSQVYSFLIKFPAYDVLLANFESDAVSYKEVFPLGLSFKCLYALYALREYIRAQSQNVGIFSTKIGRDS
jgi:ubiquitin carboxyl-terminal hydrolase 34